MKDVRAMVVESAKSLATFGENQHVGTSKYRLAGPNG
jgi:hypothetical protein